MLTRREVLWNGVRTSLALPLLGNAAFGRSTADEHERVLVVLQLTGGNDGLNTVVPHSQDAYFRLRPDLALDPGSLHRLDDDHGLHPALGGLGELFVEGRLAVIQGVGYPGADRSHFRSLEVWHTADPDGPAGDVGWLGRMADGLARRDSGSTPALAIEAGDLPLSMRGREVTPPTVRDPMGLRVDPASRGFEGRRDEICAGEAPGDLGYLREVARSTYATARRMEEMTSSDAAAAYPDHDLAQRFKLVAQLLRGGFGTRVFHLSLGGFDTHSRQAPVHADLLGRVSTALTAFQRDLQASGLEDRVATLVFSEFGRRARQNASRGTDHGQGAPVFVLGSRVRGGLHGKAPDLESLVEGDIPGSVDFRRIYSALERDWMGTGARGDIEPFELFV